MLNKNKYSHKLYNFAYLMVCTSVCCIVCVCVVHSRIYLKYRNIRNTSQFLGFLGKHIVLKYICIPKLIFMFVPKFYLTILILITILYVYCIQVCVFVFLLSTQMNLKLTATLAGPNSLAFQWTLSMRQRESWGMYACSNKNISARLQAC